MPCPQSPFDEGTAVPVETAAHNSLWLSLPSVRGQEQHFAGSRTGMINFDIGGGHHGWHTISAFTLNQKEETRDALARVASQKR